MSYNFIKVTNSETVLEYVRGVIKPLSFMLKEKNAVAKVSINNYFDNIGSADAVNGVLSSPNLEFGYKETEDEPEIVVISGAVTVAEIENFLKNETRKLFYKRLATMKETNISKLDYIYLINGVICLKENNTLISLRDDSVFAVKQYLNEATIADAVDLYCSDTSFMYYENAFTRRKNLQYLSTTSIIDKENYIVADDIPNDKLNSDSLLFVLSDRFKDIFLNVEDKTLNDEQKISYKNALLKLNSKINTSNLNVFITSNFEVVPCGVSGQPLLKPKTTSVIPESIVNYLIKGYSNTVTNDQDYGFCYTASLESIVLKRELGITKEHKNGQLFYKTNDDTEKNLDKLIKLGLLEKYKSINGYGTKLTRMMNYVYDDGKNVYDRSKLYLGAELEFENTQSRNSTNKREETNHTFLSILTNYRPFAYSTRDGSLGESGIEVKNLPATLPALMNPNIFNYEKAFKALVRNGYGATDSCGLHVHTSKTFYLSELDKYAVDDDFISELTLTVLSAIVEATWQKLVPFTRRNRASLDSWAKNNEFHRNRQLMNVAPSSENMINYVRHAYENYRGHSNAINNNRPNTFEFRIFKGTHDYTEFMASLQLVSNIANIAKDILKEIVSGIDIEAEEMPSVKNGLIKAYSTTFEQLIDYQHYEELDRYVRSIYR